MIVTVTLNAALDVTYLVDGGVRPGATHRVRAVAQRAGGKGVNTARVPASLGEPVLALGLAGGTAGAALRADLDASGIPHRLTPVTGPTRRTVAVVDPDDGAVTGFWEPGPQISPQEWESFLADFRAALDGAHSVVLAGSLPPGAPADAYAQLVRLSNRAAVPTLVDADGPALRNALGAGPSLVKPNAEEARRALGDGTPTEPPEPFADLSACVALARRLVDGGAGSAVVSAGAKGLAAVWGGHELAAAPPRVVSGNPTGAGDAASAALAVGLARGDAPEDVLAEAVALSAAAVAAPLAGDIDHAVHAELRPEVVVRAAS